MVWVGIFTARGKYCFQFVSSHLDGDGDGGWYPFQPIVGGGGGLDGVTPPPIQTWEGDTPHPDLGWDTPLIQTWEGG